MSPLVVPEVSGARALDLVRRLADVINAITRLKAAMAGASDHIVVSKNFADAGAAIAAWAERKRMLEELDQDIRDLALALQARSDRP
jgi:hydrogenase maturation factor